MSNFDFGGGQAQGYQPPIAHQVPQQSGQLAPPGPGGPPPQPPGHARPDQPADTSGAGAGITPIGLIAIVVLVLLMLGLAFLGNRVWPINSRIDSAWRGLNGPAADLTKDLRGAGFTCSDENTLVDQHYHRLCARYDSTGKVAIEFAGPRSGEVMRVYAWTDGQWTPEARDAAGRAIKLGVPDATSQQAATAIVAAGPNSTQSTKGPWGSAQFVDGVFTVARTWTGPGESAMIPGGAAAVKAKAETEGYRCDSAAPMVCTRTANGGNWKVTVTEAPNPAYLSRITLDASVNDPSRIDPAQELDVVLPASAERDRIRWFVSTADSNYGGAGFANGIVTDYRVTGSGNSKSRVVIDAYSPCRPDPTTGTPSC